MPQKVRATVWLSGGRIRWRTTQVVKDAGYADAFRILHPLHKHRPVHGKIESIEREQGSKAFEKVDAILVVGDLFDTATPTAESEKIVYAALLALAQTGATVVVLLLAAVWVVRPRPRRSR